MSYLLEAFWLWALTAGVVIAASIIHYVIASARLRELHERLEEQRLMQQPRDSTRDRPMRPA